MIDEETYRIRLGRVISRTRWVREQMTQQELALAIHRSKAAVSRWEHGKALPDAFDLHRLSKVLRIDPDTLVNPPPDQSERLRK